MNGILVKRRNSTPKRTEIGRIEQEGAAVYKRKQLDRLLPFAYHGTWQSQTGTALSTQVRRWRPGGTVVRMPSVRTTSALVLQGMLTVST